MSKHVAALAVAISLAGCASSQPSSAGGHLPYAPSGHSAAAPSDPTLYAVGTGGGAEMYDFVTGKRIGTLPANYGGATTVCIGTKQNVWESEDGYKRGTIVEYSPGVNKAIAVMALPFGPEFGCSVDLKTGDLAVPANTRIAIFPQAPRFAPIFYKPIVHGRYDYCTYDGSGNLFVVGIARPHGVFLIELPEGKTSFQTISLDRKLERAGGIVWDGTNLAIGDGATTTIYRFAVSGTQATTIGKTVLRGAMNLFYQFSVYDGTVTATLQETGSGGFGYWKYPGGGNPVQTFSQSYYHSFAVAK